MSVSGARILVAATTISFTMTLVVEDEKYISGSAEAGSVLDGGESATFFDVFGQLTMKHVELANGYDGNYAGGAIFGNGGGSKLILLSCTLSSNFANVSSTQTAFRPRSK